MLRRHILRIRGRIELLSALHIGTGDEDENYGALVVRNRQGQPVIPATTLAGLLRGVARQMALSGDYAGGCPCADTDAQNGTEQQTARWDSIVSTVFGSPGCVSRWEFEDAAWKSDVAGTDAREVRDSVGIGRQSGAAARERLFSQEVVPRGVHFVFESCLHADTDEEIALAIHCLEFWKEWDGRAGKASSAGLGAFKFTYDAERLDTWDAAQLEKHLYGDSIPCDAQVQATQVPSRQYDQQVAVAGPHPLFEAVRWTIKLLPVGPLQVKTDFAQETDDLTIQGMDGLPTQKDRPDSAFVRTGKVCGQQIAMDPYIPGRSLKGVIRSHCERILRTRYEFADPEQYTEWPHTIVCDPNGASPARLKTCASEERLCRACQLFGSTHIGGRVTVSEAFPSSVEAFSGALKNLERVSIDRITGGAADKRLFSARPLFPPREPDGALGLEFSIEMENPQAWELGLMLFTLRDLCRERLRVGFGKRVGQGKVRAAITGCALVTRPGSALHTRTESSAASCQALGCLSLSRWTADPGVGLCEWYQQFQSLGDWALAGWDGLSWALPNLEQEGVAANG